MKRTTVQTEESLLLEIKRLAEREGTTASAIIRHALREYLRKHRGKRRGLSFAGKGASGRKDVAENAEELLAESVRSPEGWGSA